MNSFISSRIFRQLPFQSPTTHRACLLFSLQKRHYKVKSNSLRSGNVIQRQGKTYVVEKTQHISKGRGSATLKADLRELLTGVKYTVNFQPSESIQGVELSKKAFEFMYRLDNKLFLLDPLTFEEVEFDVHLLDNAERAEKFLEAGMKLTVQTIDENPITISLPAKGVYRVAEKSLSHGAPSKDSEKGVNTLTAVLENGYRLTVPEFIGIGDAIEVDLQELKYISRVSKGNA